MTRGRGFLTQFGGLRLQAEVLKDGWYFRVTQIKTSKILADWTPGPAPSTSEYREPEDVKYKALTTAMSFLESKDNPHEVFRKLEWYSYGPQ